MIGVDFGVAVVFVLGCCDLFIGLCIVLVCRLWFCEIDVCCFVWFLWVVLVGGWWGWVWGLLVVWGLCLVVSWCVVFLV